MGLLTAAFAQGGHQRDNKRENRVASPSYGYQTGKQDRATNKSYGTTPFIKSNTWDSQLTRDNDSKHVKEFRLNDDRKDWSLGDRHDESRFQRDKQNKHSRRPHRTNTGFQISFAFGR